MTSGIYAIDGKRGEIYVGSAVNLKNRWKEHLRNLDKNVHHNRHLQNAWNKYGKNYFTFRVLEVVVDTSMLKYCEQIWIDIALCSLDRKDVYNIFTTATSMIGHRLSEPHKQKIAQSLTGIKHSESRKLNQSLAKKNKPQSLSTKIKLSEARRKRAARKHALQGP